MKGFEKVKWYAKLALLICVIALFLTACGGATDEEAGTTTITGVFLDNTVDGLSYVTDPPGNSGLTEDGGEFICISGTVVEFSVGDVDLGSAPCQSFITPFDLFPGASYPTHTTVVNVSVFLLSADSDGVPGGPIVIDQDARDAFTGSDIDLEDPTLDLRGGDSAIFDGLGRPVVSDVFAQDHLESTMWRARSGSYAGTFTGNTVGTWTLEATPFGGLSGVISPTEELPIDINGTFSANGGFSLEANVGDGGEGGTLDFSGTLTLTGNASGTWEIPSFEESGTFSGNRNEAAAKTVTVSVNPAGVFGIYISGCHWDDSDITVYSDLVHNDDGDPFSFTATVTPKDGDCLGQEFVIYIYDIQYDGARQVVYAWYIYQGQFYYIEAT